MSMKTTIKDLGEVKYGTSHKVIFDMQHDRDFIKKSHTTCSCVIRKPTGNKLEVTYKPKRPKSAFVHVEKEIMVEYKDGSIEIFVIKAKVTL